MNFFLIMKIFQQKHILRKYRRILIFVFFEKLSVFFIFLCSQHNYINFLCYLINFLFIFFLFSVNLLYNFNKFIIHLQLIFFQFTFLSNTIIIFRFLLFSFFNFIIVKFELKKISKKLYFADFNDQKSNFFFHFF